MNASHNDATSGFATRVFNLPSGGAIKIEATNVFMMSRKDRAIVFAILDQLIDHFDPDSSTPAPEATTPPSSA